MYKNKKGFLQISFPWIFALIVGAAILFLAIYGVGKYAGTQETVQSAKTSKEIGILLNPLETGLEEAKTSSLGFPVETRLYNSCNLEGEWGRQLLKVSQMSFNEWTDTDINVGFSNKYIFSPSPVEGKVFYIFTKPFDFPFKVADLTYITSVDKSYCFYDAPKVIEDEIKNIGQANLLLGENCTDLSREERINVCFGRSVGEDDQICNIQVGYGTKTVADRGGTNIRYFEGDALMYAAIFSSKDVYECQLTRLMAKTNSLTKLYLGKIDRVGCGDAIRPDIEALEASSRGLSVSANLQAVAYLTEEVDRKNRESICKLW